MKQDLSKTNSSVNSALSSIKKLITGVNNVSVMLGTLNSNSLNLSGNYWNTNNTLNTVSLFLVDINTWLNHVPLLAENVRKTAWNTSSTVNTMSACLNNVSALFWSAKST